MPSYVVIWNKSEPTLFLMSLDLVSPFSGVSDVDECGQDNVCLRGQCINTDGSFLCLCEAGFKYNDEAADCEGETKL